ncbi:RNA-binding S4 domain-containing protein [Streptomyces sp. CHD11]|uniref:RNA-binding S4 domain-containing protein n=1 Tax=Streptomyces sp. CHD11 TaxID=2741325 RepID=UPI001BFCB372|nr:RNA-binding S4 domain-containing protein [Streptomyces sp. CHD11]MBT3150768.1 RNA-binding S4 domain-containing protein [Streptomyces sp. CHD11]
MASESAENPENAAAVAAAEAAGPGSGESVRIDSWIWSVRLVKTRSLGAAACRGGHVRVNGERVKPSHSVRVGDEVRLRAETRERVVVVKRLIRKRVGAPVAVQCYLDNSPPPPPRDAVAPAGIRDRGTGRPTKRDRRELERLRGLGGFGAGAPGRTAGPPRGSGVTDGPGGLGAASRDAGGRGGTDDRRAPGAGGGRGRAPDTAGEGGGAGGRADDGGRRSRGRRSGGARPA